MDFERARLLSAEALALSSADIAPYGLDGDEFFLVVVLPEADLVDAPVTIVKKATGEVRRGDYLEALPVIRDWREIGPWPSEDA